ncbi:MAG TPA: DUF1499 domain-containing protein [Mesorhizobium sp.]|jgi:uncharacterized protein (DUF1499 family)|nr:DUF1499 domain-containing protein [Mesorhizobium sp.]
MTAAASTPFLHEVRGRWGKRSRLAVFSRRTAWFAALLFVISALGHRFGYLETPAFLAVIAIVAALAVLALLLGTVALVRIWNSGDRGGSDALKAALISAIVLLPFAGSAARAFTFPALSDISTDTDAPPTLSDEDPGDPFPPEQRELQAASYPKIAGRRYPIPLERAIQAVQTLFQENGWEPAQPLVGPGEATLRATAFTQILGFPSDVAVRIADEGESSFVDMRSRSRFGDHDLGDNAARIDAFLAALDQATAIRAGAQGEAVD